MKKRIVQSLSLILLFSGMYANSYITSKPFYEMVNEEKTTNAIEIVNSYEKVEATIEPATISVVGEIEEEVDDVEVVSEPLVFPDSYYNPNTEEYREEEFWDDMELIALVCVSEAEGESEYGKRLVIDTILNRLDSEYFPNDIKDIVYAEGQYECVWNGRIDKVEYDEYIANLVMEEYHERTNSEVIYFRTGHYFNFGHPLLIEGSHYFSGR